MENISSLIKEAKPLYFTRKRRRRQMAGTFMLLAVMFGLGGIFPMTQNNASYEYYLLSENEFNSVHSAATGSSIEEIGMPVDDYGLLMVG